jgi:sodium/potassium-transporting ATPase subunit alpha
VANVFACRSERMSAFRLGIFTNPLILWGIVTELTILVLIIYPPSGNAVFGTSPLPIWIFVPLALGALVLFFAEESRKFIVNRFTNSRAGKVTQQAGTS